jgi:hypothetical protein
MIASMYKPNSFHSFSHASHVVQSTVKLLSRIVRKESIDYDGMCYKEQNGDALHKFTFGITSDPITQFACILAALIHDVDHTGLPNSQLVKEKTRVAQHYNNKSVAEQNSLDLAWCLLMDPKYEDFRGCIYSTESELTRFRQLLVNAVMATDIMDKELGALRKARWAKAFDQKPSLVDGAADTKRQKTEDANRMATIVIEHLIQASDVSHTMQRKYQQINKYIPVSIRMKANLDSSERRCLLFAFYLTLVPSPFVYCFLSLFFYFQIGISTKSGTSVCSTKCTKRTWTDVPTRILRKDGTRVRLVSLTFT